MHILTFHSYAFHLSVHKGAVATAAGTSEEDVVTVCLPKEIETLLKTNGYRTVQTWQHCCRF